MNDGLGFVEQREPARILVGHPDVYLFTVGQTTAIIEGGWCGVVAINYAEGWIDVDTRYRWTREEMLASAGLLRRMFMTLRRR